LKRIAVVLGIGLMTLLLAGCGGGGGGGGGKKKAKTVDLRFDFQPDTGRAAADHLVVTPATVYSADAGHGFETAPRGAADGKRHAFSIYGRSVTVPEAVPASVLTDATIDSVVSGRPYSFRVDVPDGEYDVTLWLGDVTRPTYQVRADVNGTAVDAARMDVIHLRGRFDSSIFGNVVPRRVRAAARNGSIVIEMASHPDGANPIEWTYTQDEDPNDPRQVKTVVLVPAYTAAALAALEIHTAVDAPLVRHASHPDVAAALGHLANGDLDLARVGFESLPGRKLRAASAAGLFAVAGHPAFLDDEPALLQIASQKLLEVLQDDPGDLAARDLRGEIARMADAERYRRLYGYAAANSSAAENMGRSCALVEELPADHPYHLKGRILWIRNRGGLDPRRVTAGWEQAQLRARGLDRDWGAVNPYVHLYATDEWEPSGERWNVIDWAAIAGPGPAWARNLMSNLNSWLDLFEWWCIHRQAPEGDIGGGWTDDVEIVPAFGLMAYVLEGASVISEDAVVRFADGIWNSDIIDSARGYQAQYADVEHTAEPTGNILHLHPLVRFGDPEGIERMLTSAKTFSEFFLTDGTGSARGHRHFKGNHLSATKIATNANHRADIPLCGRVTAPFTFLHWYTGNPGVEAPLRAWATAWAEDAARTDHGKPAGVFPQAVWVPDDSIGIDGNWWAKDVPHGQFGAFPKYQFYLYSLCGYFWLETGDDRFRVPFDALSDLTLAWDAAGRPEVGDSPAAGSEAIWCGAKLGSAGAGATANVKIGSGRSDWDAYLATFGGSYARFLLDPTDPAPIDDLSPYVDALYDRWPYRTTEGLMTDRILVPGWAEVISYYIGAEVFSVFFGMPVHAVTWRDTTRLFAAAVTEASADRIGATLYRFADADREVGMRLWQLIRGASYVLEVGPADDIGLDPESVTQTVDFTYSDLGQEVRFTLPGRMVTAIRIRKTADPAAPPPKTRPDLAVAPRDVVWDRAAKEVRIRVHNVGSAPAPVSTVRVEVVGGTAAGETVLRDPIDAPLDLVPRWTEVMVPLHPAGEPEGIRVTVVPVADEITTANNTATAWIASGTAELPAPLIGKALVLEGRIGDLIDLEGKNLRPGLTMLASEAPTTDFLILYREPGLATIQIATSKPGVYLLSVKNPDGKRSNLIPITVK